MNLEILQNICIRTWEPYIYVYPSCILKIVEKPPVQLD